MQSSLLSWFHLQLRELMKHIMDTVEGVAGQKMEWKVDAVDFQFGGIHYLVSFITRAVSAESPAVVVSDLGTTHYTL